MRQTHLHLHGLMDRAPARRINTPPHDLIRCGPFCAVASRWDETSGMLEGEPEILAERAMQHHKLLLAYCDHGALLPMRFGTVFSGPQALQTAVSARASLYREALDTLADLRAYVVQVTVHTEPEAAAPLPANGRAFLSHKRNARDRRLSIHQQRAAYVSKVAQAFGPLSAMPATSGRQSAERLLDLMVLVKKALRPALADRVNQHGPEAEALGLALTVTGPWPAYTFDPAALRQMEVCHGA